MIDKKKLLEIYIREMTKYMAYENSLKAREDFLYTLEANLGKDYSLDQLKDYLEKLGSPYSLASHYRGKNIIITEKIYNILNKLLKVFAISLFLSFILAFFLKADIKDKYVYFFEISKSLIFTILFSCLLNAWISEKVKNTKILRSLLASFKIEDLYKRRSSYIINNEKFIFVFLYSFIIFLSVYFEYDLKFSGHMSLLQFTFFLLVFRDFSRFSEGERGRYISFVKIITSLLSGLILIYFVKNIIKYKFIKYAYVFLATFSFFVLAQTITDMKEYLK